MSKKPTILIVDDMPDNRLIIKIALKNENYNFIEAENGEVALQKAKECNPDVILLDAMMPIMNGYEFTRELRKIEKFKRIPILMITSLNEKKDKHKAIEAGINDFISKPFDIEELRIRCRSYMNLAEINNEYILATKDKETNLPNKLALTKDLKKYKNPFLILFKIKDYEMLQEFYGEDIVSKMTIEFSKNIHNLLPSNCKDFTLYITNDGEFALLKDIQKDKYSYEKLLNISTELYNNIEEYNVFIDEFEYNLYITLSFSDDSKKVFKQARAGLNYAIKNKKNIIYANNIVKKIRKEVEQNTKIIHLIKTALDNYKVVSYFQPLYNNKIKTIEKYESLVRIIDEKGKILSPFFFLDIAKNSHYYFKITETVLNNSFKTAEQTNKSISINLSFLDIQNKSITNKIIEYLSKNQAVAKRIVFEILEDESIENLETIKEFIKKVKTYGVQIAIDDFGSGYSNFERILELEIDILKIDGSLIKNIDTNELNKKIVKTIKTFADSIGLKTVAEFVSNEKIFNIVNEIGIDYTQGYFIDEPKAELKE